MLLMWCVVEGVIWLFLIGFVFMIVFLLKWYVLVVVCGKGFFVSIVFLISVCLFVSKFLIFVIKLELLNLCRLMCFIFFGLLV